MSGHSKWSTIKRQKGTNDAKKGVAFTKLGNTITIATREGGGGDPNSNFRLRLTIDKAREANMPKENIQRAIDRGLGKGNSAILENVLFEGFAPHGASVLVECVTDNRNRTSGEVRNLFAKAGGNLGSSGSASYLFKKWGEIQLKKVDNAITSDQILGKAMEAGVIDLIEDNEFYVLYTQTEDLHHVKEKLEASGIKVGNANLVYVPNKETMIGLEEQKEQHILSLLESLEDLDDVQNVYSNLG